MILWLLPSPETLPAVGLPCPTSIWTLCFILYFTSSLESLIFTNESQKGMDLHGKGCGKELGETEGRETIIMIYCMRKESLFNMKHFPFLSVKLIRHLYRLFSQFATLILKNHYLNFVRIYHIFEGNKRTSAATHWSKLDKIVKSIHILSVKHQENLHILTYQTLTTVSLEKNKKNTFTPKWVTGSILWIKLVTSAWAPY